MFMISFGDNATVAFSVEGGVLVSVGDCATGAVCVRILKLFVSKCRFVVFF